MSTQGESPPPVGAIPCLECAGTGEVFYREDDTEACPRCGGKGQFGPEPVGAVAPQSRCLSWVVHEGRCRHESGHDGPCEADRAEYVAGVLEQSQAATKELRDAELSAELGHDYRPATPAVAPQSVEQAFHEYVQEQLISGVNNPAWATFLAGFEAGQAIAATAVAPLDDIREILGWANDDPENAIDKIRGVIRRASPPPSSATTCAHCPHLISQHERVQEVDSRDGRPIDVPYSVCNECDCEAPYVTIHIEASSAPKGDSHV